MSRSIRGSKGPGFEYWTARPFNRCGGTLSPNGGKHTKKRTHKAERQIGRADARSADPLDGFVLLRCPSCGWLTDYEQPEEDWCAECDEFTRREPVIHRPRAFT
jgi:hypothetical protein